MGADDPQDRPLFRREAVEAHFGTVEDAEPIRAGPGRSFRRAGRELVAIARVLGDLARAPFRTRIQFVPQVELSDCAAACLVMSAGALGRKVAFAESRRLTSAGRDGVSASRLIAAGRTLGLYGRGVRIGVDDLRHLPRGAILHWNLNHFVVLERVSRSEVTVLDPAVGRRRVSRAALDSAFTGVAIVFTPGADVDEAAGTSEPSAWRTLLLFTTYPGLWVRAVVASLVLQALVVVPALLFRAVVDAVVGREQSHLLTWLLGVGAAISLLHVAVLATRGMVLVSLQLQLDAALTSRLFGHMLDLPYLFFQRRAAGDLLHRVRSMTTVRQMFTAGALSTFIDGLFAIALLVALFVVDVGIGLTVFAVALVQIVVLVATWGRLVAVYAANLEAQARTQSNLIQVLLGIHTVKASGSEDAVFARWNDVFARELNGEAERGALVATSQALIGGLQFVAPILVLAVGGSRALDGGLSLGTLVAAMTIASAALTPLTNVFGSILQLAALRSYLVRINDLLREPAEPVPVSPERLVGYEGGVDLDAVSFRYSEDAPFAVEDVSTSIRPGSFVAIVGRSGSGKSTLAMLIAGLYEPSLGTIAYDRVGRETLELRALRRQIGVVPQRPFLLAATVMDNLRFQAPDASLDEVAVAVDLAGLTDEIAALPLGYDTVLSDDASNLSGGQRQRLALAAVLLRQPRLLVLDEATNAIDPKAESDVIAMLRKVRATKVLLTHRLESVQGADEILVMEAGRIVERGTYMQLRKRGTAYSRLVGPGQSKQADGTQGRGAARSRST